MRTPFRPESLVGSVLRGGSARYRVQQLLASGGIAHVLLAERLADASAPDPSAASASWGGLEVAAEAPGDIVAVKLLRPELVKKPEVVARFEREALAASRVRHENVLAVFEEVQCDGPLSFFACEHLVGVDLADVLVAKRPLVLSRALRVVIGAARGLAAGHQAGVVHRDVKPENLFLVHSPDGREIVKVIDFGTAWLSGDNTTTSLDARITMSTSFVGTPGYMSPEQAEGVIGHPSADVYALGVVLFETLSGRPPFGGGHWMELLTQHARAPVPPLPNVPAKLFAVVERALAKRPEDRYPSAAELAEALVEVQTALDARNQGTKP